MQGKRLAGQDTPPATSSSVADQEVDVVNLSSGNPDHGHSSCARGACHNLPFDAFCQPVSLC